MVEAVVFDIDGTLLDSVDLHAQAWQDAFRHFGYDIPFEDVRSQIGKGGDQLLPVFLSKQEVEQKGKTIEEFRSKLFKDKYLPQVKPFPGVRELFLKVKHHGQQAALASSARGDELQHYERLAACRRSRNRSDILGRRRALETQSRHLRSGARAARCYRKTRTRAGGR